MEIFTIITLSLSSILLLYAGISRVIKPITSFCIQAYLENPEIKLEGEVSVFNEMRGAGASLAVGGIIILLGTIMPEFRLTSHVVAIVIFFGFAIGRLLSFALDGKPNKALVQATIFESIFGVLNIFGLVNILM